MRHLIILLSCFFLTAASSPLPTKYYTSSDIISATIESADPSATVYRVAVKCTTATDSAVLYIPMPYGTERVGLEWIAKCADADSVFFDIKYGSIFEVQAGDTAVYYETVQDSSLYWYKRVRQYSVTGPEELLSSRYFVLFARGCSKLPAAGAYLYLKVTIPKKGT